jgi:hypothetical protein
VLPDEDGLHALDIFQPVAGYTSETLRLLFAQRGLLLVCLPAVVWDERCSLNIYVIYVVRIAAASFILPPFLLFFGQAAQVERQHTSFIQVTSDS